MNYFYLILAVIVGFALPIQGALGARLGGLLPDPMYSAFISYMGGLLTCMVVLLIRQPILPQIHEIASINWYLFLPGVLGAIFVSSMVYLIPHIGVANMLVAAIIGQLLMSMTLDHFGAFGNPILRIDGMRLLGALLLLAGLICIQFTPSTVNVTVVRPS